MSQKSQGPQGRVVTQQASSSLGARSLVWREWCSRVHLTCRRQLGDGGVWCMNIPAAVSWIGSVPPPPSPPRPEVQGILRLWNKRKGLSVAGALVQDGVMMDEGDIGGVQVEDVSWAASVQPWRGMCSQVHIPGAQRQKAWTQQGWKDPGEVSKAPRQ